MNWKASPPAIEIAAVSIAAACLGGAVGFAVARLAPWGAGLVEAGGAGAMVALAACLLLARVDRRRGSRQRFAAVESVGDLLIADEVLLLDQRIDGDDVLVLDHPLAKMEDERCVLRLVAAQSAESAAAPFAGPGDMVARIEDFLGQARGTADATESARRAANAPAEDASAALHAALADIRRSLHRS